MIRPSSRKKEKPCVISLGGSLFSTQSGIRGGYLKEFAEFIRARATENPSQCFFITVGGGHLARHYRDELRLALHKDGGAKQLDEIGIAATKINAEFLKLLLEDLSAPEVVCDYDDLPDFKERVVIGAGWRPGCSTDCDAVYFAERYGAETIYNLSVIDGVFLSRSPEKLAKASAPIIKHISWQDFRTIVGDGWSPGKNAPFDPIAAKRAEAANLRVIVLNGNRLDNFRAALSGKEFVGTTIA